MHFLRLGSTDAMRPWKDKINYFKALEQNLREMGLRTRMVTVIIRAAIVIVLLRVIIVIIVVIVINVILEMIVMIVIIVIVEDLPREHKGRFWV